MDNQEDKTIQEDTNQEESDQEDNQAVEEATRDQYLCDKWFG